MQVLRSVLKYEAMLNGCRVFVYTDEIEPVES